MGINWWLWERNLVSDMGLRSVQMLRQALVFFFVSKNCSARLVAPHLRHSSDFMDNVPRCLVYHGSSRKFGTFQNWYGEDCSIKNQVALKCKVRKRNHLICKRTCSWNLMKFSECFLTGCSTDEYQPQFV